MLSLDTDTTKKFVSAMRTVPVQCVDGILGFVEELLNNLSSSDRANKELLKMIQDIKVVAEREMETMHEQDERLAYGHVRQRPRVQKKHR